MKLRDLDRLNNGSYGGMPLDEDGKYFRVADVVDLLSELSRFDNPAPELRAQLREFFGDGCHADQVARCR
jgi:hypothetical protein